jgi:hypothetical protein
VNFIEELFGKKHVVKLMGTEANPSEVLKLAKHPSENGCKQAIIHIASHCIGQKGTVRRGAITLTRPGKKPRQNCGIHGISLLLLLPLS